MLINPINKCNCKRKNCERFGKCDQCISHHKTHKRYPQPYCVRKAAKKSKTSLERQART